MNKLLLDAYAHRLALKWHQHLQYQLGPMWQRTWREYRELTQAIEADNPDEGRAAVGMVSHWDGYACARYVGEKA